ncbi:MAG: flagellar basal body-associated FliL family protein [candidate division Zixibacteria bacterium]|nr:flagellar basal body-associated FliL family protein [candidate division Zixibacteria bacterium]
MANDEENTTMEAGENSETSSGTKSGGKAGGNKLLLLGGVGLGAVVIGIAVALFVVKPMMSDSTSEDSTEQVDTSNDEKPAHGAENEHAQPKKSHDGGHGESTSLIYALGDIVINPAGTGGSRFLSVSFGFELECESMVTEFEAKEPVVRDALITILSSKTVAQLTDPKQKEIVRYQIKKRLSQVMQTDELAGVYFTDFVLQ